MNSTPELHPKNPLAIIATVLSVLFYLVSIPASASSVEAFNLLSGVEVDDELPSQSAGSAASVSRTLRPALDYPTLRLDERERRATPPAIPQPSRETRMAAASGDDFSALVKESLGLGLPRFGRDLFSSETRSYLPADQVNVPADFVIGPGDEVYVRAWGTVDIDYRAAVDRQGQIVLPKVGAVPLAGVRFGQLETHVRGAIARVFHGFELSVSLGQLKSIQVFLTGFAASPGSYSVNSLATGLNAVLLAGGPGPAGDLRRIELRRAGRTVASLDLYQFLINGRIDDDARLQPGDVIHIPAQAGEVAIAGAVNAAAIFQLKPGEQIGDLLAYAGGLSTTASDHRVLLERIDAQGQRRVEAHPLNAQTLALPLTAGDLVLVSPVSPRITNAVTLRGHVAQPFRHPWSEGLRISDLLPSRDALISPAYWLRRNRQDQWVQITERDTSTDFSSGFADVNWDYALLERLDAASLAVELIPIQLGRAVLERDPDYDLVLAPGDILTVFSMSDFKTPRARNHRFVKVEGEVQRAGIYSLAPEDTLAELLERAGGITHAAYLFGLELRREEVRQRQEARVDEAIDQLEREYQRHLIDRSRNVLSGDLSLAIPPESDAIAALIGQLRKARPTGRMVLELDPAIASATELPGFSLVDGDTVLIPPRPQTVEVVGAVIREGSFLHADNRSVKSYVEKAGPIPSADIKQIYVLRADGTFIKAGRRLRLAAGDAIVVPEKVDRASLVRRLKDWTQVLYQFGLGAAGLKILDGL